jgi:hypothetical protein
MVLDQQTAAGAQGGATAPKTQFVGSATGMSFAHAATDPTAEPAETVVETATEPTTLATPPKSVLTADLPPEALKARLEQTRKTASAEARAAVLRELGIEDPAAFKKAQIDKEAELRKYKEAEEKRRRNAMTEADRLKVDLENERKKKLELESKLEALEAQQVSHEQEIVVREAAVEYVDPEMYDFAKSKFSSHVKALMQEEGGAEKVAAYSVRDVSRFFRELVRKYPKLAKADPEDAKPEAKVEVKMPVVPSRPPIRRPLTNGAPPPRLAPKPPAPVQSAGTNANGKTFKPGQKNSMSRQELSAELKKRGLKSW